MENIRPFLTQLSAKMRESASAILPIAAIILILSVTLTPVDGGTMLLFFFGVGFLIIGMSSFTIGAEMSMQPLGAKIGSSTASSGKIWLMALVSFLIGMIVTVSEPDLQILADQVPGISSYLLILTVSVGVGVFLMFAVLRVMLGVSLRILLAVFYAGVLILAFFLPPAFRPLAFDSGGVTTGPMTVPFLMTFGAGFFGARSNNKDQEDPFGLTALASIGPIVAVLVLGLVASADGEGYALQPLEKIADSRSVLFSYLSGFGKYLPEVLRALLPILVFTGFYQLFFRCFGKKQLIRIAVGLLYLVIGLSLFLTGANVGFLPMGTSIGLTLGKAASGAWLVPVSAFLGFFIVRAEPAVYVLNKLVEQMSAGAIRGKTTGLGLSIGVAAALGLSGIRILTGIPILYILIPGYLAAVILAFFVPNIFVGIAFDSGGVASGVMMSAFVLPLCIGACSAVGGDVMNDAFGCVALVAMAPIIAIEIMGLLYKMKSERNIRRFVAVKEEFIRYGYRKRQIPKAETSETEKSPAAVQEQMEIPL